jgi:hypothetical protein
MAHSILILKEDRMIDCDEFEMFVKVKDRIEKLGYRILDTKTFTKYYYCANRFKNEDCFYEDIAFALRNEVIKEA